MTPLEDLGRTEVGTNKHTDWWTVIWVGFSLEGVLDLFLDLPGNDRHHPYGRDDLHRTCRRVTRRVLAGEGIGFQVLGSWSVG